MSANRKSRKVSPVNPTIAFRPRDPRIRPLLEAVVAGDDGMGCLADALNAAAVEFIERRIPGSLQQAA
jgi:hypothetical protein